MSLRDLFNNIIAFLSNNYSIDRFEQNEYWFVSINTSVAVELHEDCIQIYINGNYPDFPHDIFPSFMEMSMCGRSIFIHDCGVFS